MPQPRETSGLRRLQRRFCPLPKNLRKDLPPRNAKTAKILTADPHRLGAWRVGLVLLRLDSLGIREYVFFHGVGFPFIGGLGRESHNLWLGSPSDGSQSNLWESEHLYHFHRQPYCLGGITHP
jgi:hypothetical protein